MDDHVYEAIGVLLRGVLFHEQSGGRTPEHLAGQVRRAIAILSPAIAAEVEQDGAARVYEERWEEGGRRDLEFAPPLNVACPTCHAKIGESCRPPFASEIGQIHVARANQISVYLKQRGAHDAR